MAERNGPSGRMDFDVEIAMRDGTILRCDIYRPLGMGPVPALLTRTPYDKRVRHRSHMGMDLRAATARGYAIVSQDVRGRFASGGEFLVTPTQKVEGPDGYDTIEWLAAQDWCSGAVGTFGSSYASLTQLMAAGEHPPSLRAIIAEKTGTPARGAIMLDSIMLAWAAGQALDWLQKAEKRQAAGAKEAAIIQEVLTDPQKAAQFLPLDDMPLMKIGGLPSFQQMVDSFHKEDGMDIASIDVPALIVSGWFDIAPRETAQIYETLLKRKNGAETDIVVGIWEHMTATAGLGNLFFGAFASGELFGISNVYLDFFDRHLKGDKSKPATGARYFVMGANTWRAAPTWPPAHREQAFCLASGGRANSASGDGTLSTDAPAAKADPDRYRYDPLDPVPSIGGHYFEVGGSRAGPFDQRRVEERKDVLVYSSERLEKPVEIAGSVRLKLFVTCSTPDTDFAVKLCDVHPDGTSYNMLSEFFRCRWRDGYSKTVLFEPGKITELDIDMGPVAHRFLTGHRMRLLVTSSEFPGFDRNMNTGHEMGVDAKGLVAEITVFHDRARPSALVLPVVDIA